jgi:hypothetical protein
MYSQWSEFVRWPFKLLWCTAAITLNLNQNVWDKEYGNKRKRGLAFFKYKEI